MWPKNTDFRKKKKKTNINKIKRAFVLKDTETLLKLHIHVYVRVRVCVCVCVCVCLCVHLRTKFEVSSLVLASFRQGEGAISPFSLLQNETLKISRRFGLMSKNLKKAWRVLNYIDHLLILASIIIGYILIFAFTSLVGIPTGITSSAMWLKFCAVPKA